MKFKSLFLLPLTLVLITTSVSAGKTGETSYVSPENFVSYFATKNTIKNPLIMGQGNNDLYLEDGYPLSIWHTGGSYQGGAFIEVAAANLDNDNTKEFIISSLANGPLNVFNSDGSVRSGFPVNGGGVGYSASLDNYIVSAFTGDCNPTCRSYVNLYNGNGSLLWSKPTLGSGVDTAPVIFKEDGHIRVLYEDAIKVYLTDINGTTLSGWPKTVTSNRTFAVADLDANGSNEIIIFNVLGNAQANMYIYRQDGSLYAQTAPFGVQVRAYPVVGDVDGDGQLEIVLLGRNNSANYAAQLSIFDHLGIVQAQYTLTGDRTSYGTQTSLADINNDSIPEILFLTENKAYVMDAAGNNLPGWPKLHSPDPSYPPQSNILVGDVVSDGEREFPEIIYTLRTGTSHNGAILIFNHDGTPVDRWDNTQLYPISSGRSNTLVDMDSDGFNEIIIASDYWNGISGYYPAIWAFDLNKGQRPISHGPVEWGGYSNDTGKTGLYVKPSYN